MTVGFRRLTDGDFGLLHRWLYQPHVARWWGDPPPLQKIIELYRWKLQSDAVFPYLMLLDEQPIGYIQSYDAPRVGGGWWPDEPPGTWGVDAFIGEPELLGQGHGSALLERFSNDLLARDEVLRVIADPHPDNARGIRAYTKAGFESRGPIETPQGPALLMVKGESSP